MCIKIIRRNNSQLINQKALTNTTNYTLLILKYGVKLSTRIHESHLHTYIP